MRNCASGVSRPMVYKLSDIRILLVEDMQPMLNLTKSILNLFGFKYVYTAHNGEEAFKVFQEQQPDVVITDWLMEPVSGPELIEKIRRDPKSHNPYIPIILMTGYSDKPRVEMARDKGVTEFLSKPFSARDLYSRIVQIIEKPRPFVNAGDFFGPDRRRKHAEDFKGPTRRDADEDNAKVSDFALRDLRETVKKL